jgi:hypothetical protein
MRELPRGATVTRAEMRVAVEGELRDEMSDRAALGAFRDVPFVAWVDFWRRDRAEQDWLLDRILARGRGHAIYAAQKAGKSLLLLWAAVTLATGQEPIVVVYADFEMTEDDLFERLTDMGYGPETDLSRLKYALLPSLPPLDTAEGSDAFLALLDRAARPDHHTVAIIDTYGRAVAGDENASDTTRAFYRHTGLALKQRGVTWVRSDHSGKDSTRGQRGSSAKGDDVDVVWRLERTDDGFVLRRDAARMGWVPERVALERQDEPLSFVIGDEAWPAGTKELADQLAELQVPTTASNKTARAALKAAGRKASTALLSAAVKYRKGNGTLSGMHRDEQTGTDRGTRHEPAQPQGGTDRGTRRNADPSPNGTFPPTSGGTGPDRSAADLLINALNATEVGE